MEDSQLYRVGDEANRAVHESTVRATGMERTGGSNSGLGQVSGTATGADGAIWRSHGVGTTEPMAGVLEPLAARLVVVALTRHGAGGGLHGSPTGGNRSAVVTGRAGAREAHIRDAATLHQEAYV